MMEWMKDGGMIEIKIEVIEFVIYMWWKNEKESVFERYGLEIVIGGEIGNIIERVMNGYVVDYVIFKMKKWYFEVLNIEDELIKIGEGMIIMEEFIGWRRERI